MYANEGLTDADLIDSIALFKVCDKYTNTLPSKKNILRA